MLPLAHKIAFLAFAVITGLIGVRGFYHLFLRIQRGRSDPDARWDRLPSRIWYALITTLLQRRTFRKRPAVSLFHAFIFYGFVFYLLVNLVDGMEGFFPFTVLSTNWATRTYNLVADLLSFLVLVGVIALIARRFFLPPRRDFRFNEKTMLHEDVQHSYISRDSLIVSGFILFHVGSRAIGEGARLALEGPDRFQPFATFLSHAFTASNAGDWRIFAYWGALGSVLAFLMYFPYSKHIHMFMAPLKYLVARQPASGVLPALDVKLDAALEEAEEQQLGAKKIEDLSWPRLLDAYACIQCNRCQDVCPATATGKALSPAALEINKRMELNHLAKSASGFETGNQSPRALLGFALSPEAAWACTTCGACMQVCPVQDEQMLDIIDIRRNQVMMEGEFPTQLQTAFRGMERTMNPWGINHDQRMAWAEGLKVPSIEENPNPDVLYWVGCAASYDPQSQKTARALVQLLTHAGVNFAVLGKRECCTGDTARRTGNEYLYSQLAHKNIDTLNAVRPRVILATCPHCMNTIGHEYRQLGGEFKVMHHSEFLESLVKEGRLETEASPASVTYHDPCYLGRHNGVYDAPRNLLRVLSNDFVELGRARENSFCCGAGGGQFWKEEEAGSERVSSNRYREVEQRLASRGESKVLAVGCPFCKSMLSSTPDKDEKNEIAIKDIAELLWEGVLRKSGESLSSRADTPSVSPHVETIAVTAKDSNEVPVLTEEKSSVPVVPSVSAVKVPEAPAPVAERKKWTPKRPANPEELQGSKQSESRPQEIAASTPPNGSKLASAAHEVPESKPEEKAPPAPARKKWSPKSVSAEKDSVQPIESHKKD